MKSLYKSAAGKIAISKLYDAKLDSLKVDYSSIYVETQFGRTHILKVGDESKPPLVVIHGSNGCAPVAIETYAGLLDSFSLYAVDVLAQPNRSAETRLSMKNDDYGKWMNELLDNLGLKNVVLAGFSFGGLVILKTLIHNEENIKEVFLSAPAYIVNGNPLKALLRFFIPMKRYMKNHNTKYLNQFLASAFTAKDEFAFNFLGQVFRHFEMDFTPVPVISSKSARLIKTPISIFAAGDDIVFPGAKMIKRARKIFPSIKTLHLLKESKHVQNQEDNEFVVGEIKASI